MVLVSRPALAAVLAVALAVPAVAEDAKPTAAPTFVGGYVWKQLVVQGVADRGGYSAERGDFNGGRLVAGLGIGRLGMQVRVDASGLKDQFNERDVSTYQTLELYVSAHYVLWAARGFQLGPAVAVGSLTPLTKEKWTGVGLDLSGAGVRLGGHGGEVQLLATYSTGLLAEDPAARLALVAHVRLTDRLYAVGDAVSGLDGFVRVGFAVRAF